MNTNSRNSSSANVSPALILALSCAALLAAALAGTHLSSRVIAAPLPSLASPAAMESDKGEFRISVNGQPVGTESFEIRPDGNRWIAQGTADVKPTDGPASKITSHLTLQPDGTPLSYDWKTEGTKKASAEIQFQNSIATVNLHLEGRKPFTQQFTFSSPMVVILDNNLYHQYAVLARLYDRTKKGSQTFAVLVPQEMTPGSVTVDSIADPTDTSPGELKVQTSDLEVDLYIDAKGRLMRLVAPASNAEVIRK
jgi:hypothetical protein